MKTLQQLADELAGKLSSFTDAFVGPSELLPPILEGLRFAVLQERQAWLGGMKQLKELLPDQASVIDGVILSLAASEMLAGPGLAQRLHAEAMDALKNLR